MEQLLELPVCPECVSGFSRLSRLFSAPTQDQAGGCLLQNTDRKLTVLMMVAASHQNEVFLKLNTRLIRRVTKRDPVHLRHTQPRTMKPQVCHADKFVSLKSTAGCVLPVNTQNSWGWIELVFLGKMCVFICFTVVGKSSRRLSHSQLQSLSQTFTQQMITLPVQIPLCIDLLVLQVTHLVRR